MQLGGVRTRLPLAIGEVAALKKEAGTFTSVSDFVQSSKLQRKVIAKEKEVEKLQLQEV